MHILLPESVLAHFGAALVAPLGGRLNQHWLVDAAGKRLVLRRWAGPAEDVAYEISLLAQVAALGWPVAPVVAGPMMLDGVTWSLAPFLPGAPPDVSDPQAERRARGRLLAAFHADLSQLAGPGQRPGWRRGETILADLSLDALLAAYEQVDPDEGHLLRWHLERARARAVALSLAAQPGQVIHGDFTPWNLCFNAGHLSGVLDFELARVDHRVAEFALAWRGAYDEVIHSYAEVAPLEPEEWAALTPLWWAYLIDGLAQLLRQGRRDDGWTAKMLHRRSPLMGPDATPYPGRL
jgi:aminoglycoside phosphotransferase (APT) family kinase protein